MNFTNISEKFFTGCQKMKDEGDLKEYQNKADEFSKLPLRGNVHISGTQFKPDWVSDDSEDVYLRHFDKDGNKQKFVKDYIIQRTGQVYHLKSDGSKKYMKLDNRGYFHLYIKDADGKSKKIQVRQTFLQITSYFANYTGWDVIMKNRGTNGSAQVDHVQQENKPYVDIQCLDLVTHEENNTRRDLAPKSIKTHEKKAISQGKPYTITIREDGEDDIVLNARSTYEGVDLLKERGIAMSRETISNRLHDEKEYMKNGKTIRVKYTQEFLESQKTSPGENWRKEKDWDLNEYKEGKGPPKEISNFGRLKNKFGTITYGNYKLEGNEYINYYNDVHVSRLVAFAFNDRIKTNHRQGYKDGDTVVRHINDHECDVTKKYRIVEIDGVERRVLSNHIDTLEFGTSKENNQDISKDLIYKDKQDPLNEFYLIPKTPKKKNLKEISGTFHSVPEFLKEQKTGIEFHNSNVNKALRGIYGSCGGYKFTFVIGEFIAKMFEN